MTMKTASGTGDSTLVATPCDVFGLYCRAAGTAGTIALRDGGSGGTILVSVPTPAAVSGFFIDLSDGLGNGVEFATDCFLDVTTADGAMIIYK